MIIHRTSNYQPNYKKQNFKARGEYPAKAVREYVLALTEYFRKKGLNDSEIQKRVAEAIS